jgi:hypothetical protein
MSGLGGGDQFGISGPTGRVSDIGMFLPDDT